MLQQIFGIWSELSFTRRTVALAGLTVTALAIFLMIRLATTPGFALLYGNLTPSQAGEVITSLDGQGARYQVRGSSVYVEEGRRDELRMLLATEGLPANSSSGYELLDKLTGFGTTSQMFDAAYSRAIEGELARTIEASSFVRDARVHIAMGKGLPFQRSQSVSASVFVRAAGFELSDENARALRFLVASAVTDLDPKSVAIIDSNTGRVVEDAGSSSHAERSGERSVELQQGVKRILEAHVGRGNAMVEVNLETVTDTESIVERRFDPEGRVAVSTDTQEIARSQSGPSGGAVTVASNVPGGDAAGTAGETQSQDSELRERTNFEVSEVQREVLKEPGAIKRLTVAVLVNGIEEAGEEGVAGTWRARTEAELSDLRELVESAVGYREDRGDIVTIKSLQFEPILNEGSASARGGFDLSRLDPMMLVQLVVLSIVVLLLGLFVVRPVLTNRSTPGLPAPENSADLGMAELDSFEASAEVDESFEDSALPALSPIGDFGAPMAVIDDYDFDGGDVAGGDTAVDRLKQVIEARQPDTIEILRNWLEESDTFEEVA